MTFAAESDTLTANHVDLNESIVTATKVKRTKNDLPSGITILNQKTLEREQTLSIKELSAAAPNVYIPDFGSSLSAPMYIRGIGSRRLPAIGMYYDGIPLLEGAMFDTDFSDLTAVEILRGPQGTLYGRGAMGGVISLVTYRPLSREGIDLTLRGGSHGLWGAGATVYHRVKQELGLSAGINYLHRGGYFTNAYNNRKADASDAIAAKVAAQWQSGNGWKLYGFVQYQYKDQGGYAYAPVDSNGVTGQVNYNDKSSYRRHLLSVGFEASKLWRNGILLRMATGFQSLDDRMTIDQDFTPQPKYYGIQTTKKNIATQEISLQGNGGRYTWLAGVYGFYGNGHRDMLIAPTLMHYGEPNVGGAVFHQSAYRLTRNLTVEAGIRADLERIGQDYRLYRTTGGTTAVMTDLSTGKTFSQITPKWSLIYEAGARQRLYATVARGYQPGGFNTSFDTDAARTYKPEYSWNYELGGRFSLLDGRLAAEAAVFLIDWRQQQITQPLATGRGTKITNAGKSLSKGAELSLTYRPMAALTIATAYGYTHAVYKEYLSGSTNYADKYIQQVPRHTLMLSADYTWRTGCKPIEQVTFSAQYKALGKVFWNDANTLQQSFYGTMNAQITVEMRHASLGIWVKNAFDKTYNTYYFTSFGAAYAQKGAPMHAGVTFQIYLR